MPSPRVGSGRRDSARSVRSGRRGDATPPRARRPWACPWPRPCRDRPGASPRSPPRYRSARPGARPPASCPRRWVRRPRAAAAASPCAPELPLDLLEGEARDDGAAVRAEVRRLRAGEIGEQPRHLLALERRVRLDGGTARDEGQRPVDDGRGRGGSRRADLVQEPIDQPARLLRLEEVRNGAEQDTAAAEILEGEAERLQIAAPLREETGLAGAELERLRKEERLRGEGAGGEVALELLEEHALMGHVLVDEEDLLVVGRHHEGVLELADHAAEAAGPEGCRRLAEERALRLVGPRDTGGGRTGHVELVRPRRAGGGQARLRLHHALRAQSILHGAEHRLLEEAWRAEAYPRLGRVHVHVDLGQGQLEGEHGHGELVPRE